jgi:amino acid adenylation domain-containing protein/non-ribosomal peptide synthase protein (TIGR01720 family)
MNFNTVEQFLISIITVGAKIWVEHNRIKLSLPDNISLTSDQNDFIKHNRETIVDYLQANNILSANDSILIKTKNLFQNKAVLSFAQERLWFVEKYMGGTNAYNIPMAFKVASFVDRIILEEALQSIIMRHEILRTFIRNEENEIYQLISDSKHHLVIKKKYIDQINLDEELENDAHHIYDLGNEYPIRICFYEINETAELYISIVIHHIAFDGWSNVIFFKELSQYYNYIQQKKRGQDVNLDLPDLPMQYKDFSLWQRMYLNGEKLHSGLDYWKTKLYGYKTLKLPTYPVRPELIDYRGEDLHFEIDEHVSESLKDLAKDLKVSLYSILLSAYCLMLKVYSNQTDIVIGSPIANRHYHKIEHLIGFFVNTLVLRIFVNTKSTVIDFIQQVGNEVLTAQSFQDLPFEKLVNELKVPPDTSRHPIFQIIFALQNFDDKETTSSCTQKKLLNSYQTKAHSHRIAKFDLSTIVDDSKPKIRCLMNFAVSIFKRETVQKFGLTYVKILKELARFTINSRELEKIKVFEINTLEQNEYEKIINVWNSTNDRNFYNTTILHLFQEQVSKSPDKLAIVYEDQHLMYRELNERSNQLAHYLCDKFNINQNTLVALFLDRTELAIISMLAVLKTGAAYVPLDPSYPNNRIEYILKDTKSSLILTNQIYQEKLHQIICDIPNYYINNSHGDFIRNKRNHAIQVLEIDDIYVQSELVKQATSNPKIKVFDRNLAYVIYTSGTSGEPKGVMIEHKSLTHLIKAQEDILKTKEIGTKNCLAFASFVFDAHVWEIYTTLVNGNTLYLISDFLRKSLTFLSEYIRRNKINLATLPPVILNEEEILNLKALIFAGETAYKNLFDTYKAHDTRVFNAYGPTEATVCATINEYNYDGSNNIGKPLLNSTIYILNQDLEPVPEGTIGELYIGGVGVARGYLNNPILTMEKFIANPFLRTEIIYNNSRLYKTGDLAKWLADGSIEYIGRNDHQIKIRGYRIELQEIEYVLLTCKGVNHCVVTVYENEMINNENVSSGEKYLVGYYVSTAKLNENEIFSKLRQKLPDYMIPVALVHIQSLPLTIHGKLDRKALPKNIFVKKDCHVLPRNEIEKILCQKFALVLNLTEEKIGVHDNFFSLGGNSILAIRLVNVLNKVLNSSIEINLIFKYNTIASLASYLILKNATHKNHINKIEVVKKEQQLLSFAQERIWFFEKFGSKKTAYHIPMVFQVPSNIKLNILITSIINIIKRHEIFRTLIKEDTEGNTFQLVCDECYFEVGQIKVESIIELDNTLHKEINKPFDLYNEHPIRVSLYELKGASYNINYYLGIVIHHIAFDGWSADIFLNELQYFYTYYLNPATKSDIQNLPELRIQYKDFALWQRRYLTGEAIKIQVQYWQNKLEGFENLNLVTDFPRPNDIDYNGANIYFEIDHKTSTLLRKVAKELQVSLFSVLLSGYFLLLRTYSNQDDIIVGTPVANRHFNEVECLIGCFVNTVALRSKINVKTSLKNYIRSVWNDIVDSQTYQDLPFEKLVDELKLPKDPSKNPVFQVLFEIQGFTRNDKRNLLLPYERAFELYKVSKFDVSTTINDSQEVLKGNFNYAKSLYKETTISALAETYIVILQQIATSFDEPFEKNIADLCYLNQQKYNQIVVEWNISNQQLSDMVVNKTIPMMFEEQVFSNPNNIAIKSDGSRLSYQTLNIKANQLAHFLTSIQDILPDTIVGLCLSRSEYMMIAVLGVLKAGAAYVPIDPSYPNERMKYIAEDAKIKIILTDTENQARIYNIFINADKSQSGLETSNVIGKVIVVIDSKSTMDTLVRQPEINLIHSTDSRLAYIIYTSGTTGKPKGVMVEQKSLVNLLRSMINIYSITKHDNFLSYRSFAFDGSIEETLLPLVIGAKLSICKEGIKDLDTFLAKIQEDKISILNINSEMAETLSLFLKKSSIKKVIAGGTRFNPKSFSYFFKKNIIIFNTYGPSEATVNTTCTIINDLNISIGKPIHNIQCYILNTQLVPLPIGAIGELYIGGAGIARGYINNPELTAANFIPNPFLTKKERTDDSRNIRLYRTGDLARWLADGNIEYVGRNDSQIKIRGFRIEIEEIENVIINYKDIKQSVVIVKENNIGNFTENKYLLGFYTAEHEYPINDILGYLQRKLPDYMIPSDLIYLEKMPLSFNGKLDRKALHAIKFIKKTDTNHTPPRNESEWQLCKIWAETLSLPVNSISINNNFFKLGGNSISAIRLMSKINKEFQKTIQLSSIFQYPTIESIVNCITSAKREKIKKQKIKNPIEQVLSFAQERLWFIEKYEQGTNAYNIPMVFKLAKDIKLGILENSIRSIVTRHEILRTVIKEDNEGRGYQLVIDDKEHPLEIKYITVRDKYSLDKSLIKEANYIYDLSKEYPIKVFFYKLKGEYYLSIVVHHIAFDGWSTDILLNELQTYYNYYLEQSKGSVSSLNLLYLTIQYKDFALWQRSYLRGEKLEKQLNYWKSKLDGYETLNLTTNKVRPTQIDYTGTDIFFELDRGTSIALRELAKELKVSLYCILLTGYYLMLRAYSNQDDIVIGTTVANRHYNQVEGLIGFFVNSLALRVQIDSSLSIKEFIYRIWQEVISAQTYQDLPFEKLVEELKVIKDTSRNPIFQIMFDIQGSGNNLYNKIGKQKRNGRILQAYKTGVGMYGVAKFDISTFIDDSQTKLKGLFNYAINLYNKEIISSLINTYKQILNQFASLVNSAQLLQETGIENLIYLNKKEYREIIHTWCQTDKAYPENKTIHSLFEEQVEKTPDNVAVVYKETKLTYKELNERANQLANYIKQYHDIRPDTLIALCLDKSEHTLIAILAILKVGGAYVPMDPGYPDERIKYILEDTKTKLVLANAAYQQRLQSLIPITKASILVIDENNVQQQLSTQFVTDPNITINSTNLAYVIYTSGTTGTPKGVMVHHKGVVNYICNIKANVLILPEDKVDFSTNIGFDLTITTTICSLCLGSQIVIYYSQLQDIESYKRYLITNDISVIKLVSSYFELLIDFLPNSKINKVILGGEKLEPNTINKVRSLENGNILIIYDEYGPTEATVGSCITEVYPDNNLTIGRPYNNYKVYILDTNLTPLPIGAIGELHVGGEGLARGYFNRPELTAEKFIANPFQTEEEKKQNKNARLYKTGDLARWLPDGNLEYIGRNDFQVKIRGHRIELGEIESALLSHGDVSQAVVVAKDGNIEKSTKTLVAYIVPGEFSPSITELKSYLTEKLPEYMVPSVLVHLEQLPLTINGKLDRKALPDPEFTGNDNYVAPRNELEQKISKIWSEVLGLPEDKVSIQDDFFRLGGDSIISIQLVSRLRQRLGLDISVKDVFSYRNIESLYNYVLSKKISNDTKLTIKTEQGILSGQVPLLPIQEWFFNNKFTKSNHWNQAFILKTPSLGLHRLQESVIKLIEHHDAFRLRYKRDKNAIYQYYDDKATPEILKVLDIKTLGFKEGSKKFKDKLGKILTSWQSGFDLKCGATYSIGYIHGYKDGSSKIFFALHHLIVDTVSWRILAEDLRDIYNGKELGRKGSSYRQWVNTVKEYANAHEAEKVYWTNILFDYDSNNNQLNKLVVSEMTRNYSSLQLSQEQTKQLLQESNRAYNTQVNDILLTALGLTIAEVTNSIVNHIVLEGHGREEIDKSIDISRTLGWFTTMFPVRLEVKAELSASIKNIKESLRQIPNKGIGYGSIIGYREILPRISFNYLGQFDQQDSNNNSDVRNLWNIVNESTGEETSITNQDYNIININGLVIDGSLQFNIVSKFDKKTTDKLAEILKQKLEEIIDYTVNQTRSYFTVSDVDNIISQEYLDNIQESREITGVYLANSLQQGFVYHALSQGDIDEAYCVQMLWHYHSSIKVELLEKAWIYASKKFSSLRLRFAWGEKVIQIIDKLYQLDWKYIDLSQELDEAKLSEIIKSVQNKDILERYKLEEGKLFRIYIIKQRSDLYTCLFSNHHAILDGWSTPLLLKYVHDTYLSLLNNKEILLEIDSSYQEAQRFLQQHKDNNEEYWISLIKSIEITDGLQNLISDRFIKLNQYRYIKKPYTKQLIIDNILYEKLKNISGNEGITINAILQYVWHKIISIYSNIPETMVGTVVSGRTLPINNIETSVGLYINTLPLIVRHKEKESIIDAIRNIQKYIHEMNNRSNISLAKLQNEGVRLFNNLFVYENYPLPKNSKSYDLLKITYEKIEDKLDYPIVIVAYEFDKIISFNIQYASELFSNQTISQLLLTVKTLLGQIVNNPYQSTRQLTSLSLTEFNETVINWNQTKTNYTRNGTIHSVFEEQVKKSPKNIAILFDDRVLTYTELNEKANRLARYLINTFSIKPDTLIALYLDVSEYMLIAILAVFKSGSAYVPINPSFPTERIKHILCNAEATIVLTNIIYQKRLKNILSDNKKITIIAVDDDNLQNYLPKLSSENLSIAVSEANLAYVIYTSGTTGLPKGVMIDHRSILNLKQYLTLEYSMGYENNEEVILLLASYVFDASVEQYILALLNGYKLLLLPDKLWLDKDAFYNYLNINKVTHIDITPTLYNQYNFNNILSLRRITFGGERLDTSFIKDVNYTLINTYGPTETSVTFSVYRIKNGNLAIGKPIANGNAYILDGNLNPLPIGAIGELYIGGVGLARGYLNDPILTAEKFIANPFQNEKRGIVFENFRLYKTGDLVRWLPNGNLEYVGRNDFQVKIRGNRVELGEIEAAMSLYKGVKQSIVLVKEYDERTKYLVGYYVAEQALDTAEIETHLRNMLPEYMIPSMFLHLYKLPVTSSGKLDRKALPEPKSIESTNYLAPRDKLEHELCCIWGEVLNIPVARIGINDDFFKLGGDSIVSIQLISRFRKNSCFSAIGIQDIFTYRTIKMLYDNVLAKKNNQVIKFKTEQGVLNGRVNLLPIQQWFFDNKFVNNNYFNQSFLIKVPYSLDIELLNAAINELVMYHDAFRLRYKKTKNKNYFMQYYDKLNVNRPKLHVLDVRSLDYRENTNEFREKLFKIMTEWQNNFELTEGLKYAVGYLYGYEDNSSRIFFALHHLIVDTVSWRIIIEDLQNCYYGKDLGAKGSSYRQWVQAIREYAKNHQTEQYYWRNVLADFHVDALTSYNNFSIHSSDFYLEKYETSKLLHEVSHVYNTKINGILLTALGYTLWEVIDKRVNYVILEGHGREEINVDIDITRTVGWFTTLYPIRLEVYENLGQSIQTVKEMLRQIPNGGVGYGAILGYIPENMPRICFNYLGQFDRATSEETKKPMWVLSEESSGISADLSNQDSNLLTIDGMVLDSRLTFTITSKLEKSVAERLSEVFKMKLLEIIDYCGNKKIMAYKINEFKNFEPYVICNSTKIDRKTFFLLPPGSGGAESYLNNIAPQLTSVRVVLFNNFYKYMVDLDKKYESYFTFEELSQYYISYIKSIQPSGPYNLFGWSFGGVLAFEISRQLTSMGDKVDNLIILDSFFDYKSAVACQNINLTDRITDDINYKYSPSIKNTQILPRNIILFKTTQLPLPLSNPDKYLRELRETYKMHYNIAKYYLNTQFNNLDQILPSMIMVKTIRLDCDHDSCLKDKKTTIKIVQIICNLFKCKIRAASPSQIKKRIK